MKVKNVKGIIWDLDGTLLDSFAIFEAVIADIVKELGYVMPSQQTILHNYHGSLEDSIKGSLGIESIVELESIVEKFLVGQNEHYKGNLNDHLFTDAAKLAQAAAKRGLPQVLVTNRSHKGRGFASPRHIIASTFLADCIQEVRPGDEVDFNKPDKRALGDWLTRHNLLPEDVIVIGDQAVDGELAINLGARAILVKRGASEIPHFDPNSSADVLVVDQLDSIELI